MCGVAEQYFRRSASFDPVACALYSTDASIYEIKPLGVVIRKHAPISSRQCRFCAEHHVPLIARGGGTSQTGAALGRGIILDCGKYMRGVAEVNLEEGWARVEPGVVPDELNAQLRPSGMMFPVDISPSNRASIGGMCATNAGGSASITYGIMRDNVRSMDALLVDGTGIFAGPLSPAQTNPQLAGYPGGASVSKGHAAHCRPSCGDSGALSKNPAARRRLQPGHFLNGEPFNLKNILMGSEGTLAVTLQAQVKLVPRPKHTALGVLHFRSISDALESTGEILPLRPNAIELVDKYFLDLTPRPVDLSRRMQFRAGRPGRAAARRIRR